MCKQDYGQINFGASSPVQIHNFKVLYTYIKLIYVCF